MKNGQTQSAAARVQIHSAQMHHQIQVSQSDQIRSIRSSHNLVHVHIQNSCTIYIYIVQVLSTGHNTVSSNKHGNSMTILS